MKDMLFHRRIKDKNGRIGLICNRTRIAVAWDSGGVTEKYLEDLEFIEEGK